MKIKRYTAASMRAALAQVRAEQGPDAVILSSRRNEEGIEVIAAVDYDEALFLDANRQRVNAPANGAAPLIDASPVVNASPAMNAAPVMSVTRENNRDVAAAARAAAAASSARGAGRAPAAALSAESVPAAAMRRSMPNFKSLLASAMPALTMPAPAHPVRPSSAPTSPSTPPTAATVAAARSERTDIGYTNMQRELRDMRRLLESGLAGMTWSDKRLREPLKAQVLEELTAIDIAPDVALALAELTPRRTGLDNSSHIPLALLVKHLPVVDDLSTIAGGVMALVGPTGAGKTTTIAKLAARWCMRHGSQDLALVSTDGYRIGAREQLMTYSRILGAPMHVANSGKELGRLLERLKTKKLILIDTAGMGPRDVRLTEQLSALQLGAARARVLLALPAQGEGHALEEIVRAYARVKPAACIITKVDEAASLGGVISTTLRHKLKIAYVCDGQRVPEDMHAAHQKRVWLLKTALKLKEGAAFKHDEAYFARTFGRVPAHA